LSKPPIEHHVELDSTQAELHRRLAQTQTPPYGLTVCARRQTAGRGRFGRRWENPAEALMWSSWLPNELPPQRVPMTTLAAGLALHESLAPWVETTIKWPNDLVAPDHRKLAGILTEGVWSRTGHLRGSIIGIGINIDWPDGHPPTPLAAKVTSWRAWCMQVPEADIVIYDWLDRCRRHLQTLFARPASFCRRFNAALWGKGRRVALKAL